MKEHERWARDVGLDTSAKKGQWEISVTLETTGELPERVQDPRRASFWLKIVPNGWWVVVSLPLDGGKRVRKAHYVSWNPEGERWHELIETLSGVAALPKARVRPRERLEPPSKLRTIRTWLSAVEEKLGITFRRDRPLIESNVKGGAKAMAAWIGG